MAAAFVLPVQVTPRSVRDEVVGWQDNVLRVRLRAPPVDGRANEALCRLIAARLGLPSANIAVVGGRNARRKWLRVEAMEQEAALARLVPGHSGAGGNDAADGHQD